MSQKMTNKWKAVDHPNDVKPDATIEVTLKVPIKPDSKLVELFRKYSEVALAVMALKRQNLKPPVSLVFEYNNVQEAVKAALVAEFGFSFPVENFQLDTEHFLSYAEHCVILAPEG